MQGLADGYFILPYTIGDYIAQTPQNRCRRIVSNSKKQKLKRGANQSVSIWQR